MTLPHPGRALPGSAHGAPRPLRWRWLVLAAVAAVAAALSGCSGGGSGSGGPTTITFFQFKGEAQQYFKDLAAQFERANPDIHVVVDNPADPETALRTRLVKDAVPDVMTLNANGTFGEFASAKIFRDFRNDPSLTDVNAAYLRIIAELGAGHARRDQRGAVRGERQRPAVQRGAVRQVPRGGPEDLRPAHRCREANSRHAGITPFYGMLADAWTAQSPLAPLSAQLQPADFFPQRFEDKTTFAQGWRTTAERARRAVQVHPARPAVEGLRGRHRRVRQGRVGDAAAGQLRGAADPARQTQVHRRQHGTAGNQRPVQDDAWSRASTSCITASRNGAHPKESERADRFLMQRKVMADYCKAQVAIPALKGLTNNDPALAGVQRYIDSGRIVGFTDHQFIPAIPLAPLLQTFMLSGNNDAFLDDLDADWDRVAQATHLGHTEQVINP